jgi:hypothetical protein
MEKTIAELAKEAAGYFTMKQRNGETIHVLADERPQWVLNLVRIAHDEMLPDDWRFASIASALEAMAESEASDTELQGGDLDFEWADANVDTYTSERFAWLSSHLSRQGYVDEAHELLGTGEQDIAEQIGAGQYVELREVWDLVLQALIARRDELEADETIA